ncbi:MAG TPA: glycosyltransferase [Pirellulales bacterium]|jgi:glycosyltransferase involved in cell wall biosynthesis|nr:glycosyltransferase [Pirellulales bacterium]
MITRNNERTIAAAVESIKPHVGQIVVVDTGSTDGTVEICRSLGCEVYHFPWPDSFSIARNESLKYARGLWVIWIDSDDEMDAESGRGLVELLSGPVDPNILGLTMQVHCPAAGRDGGFDITVVDHCKVFRNRPDIRFEGGSTSKCWGRSAGPVARLPIRRFSSSMPGPIIRLPGAAASSPAISGFSGWS